MRTEDLFEETYFALSANKARSGLTILGIVIGIASVIAMISIGTGTQNSISANIQSLGSNLILVSPGAQRGVGQSVSQGRGSAQTLTMDDYAAIQTQSTLYNKMTAEVSSRTQIIATGTNTNASVDGTTADYTAVRNVSIDLGNFISDQDVTDTNKIAVLGSAVRDDLFGAGADPTGQSIKIKNIEFTVVGVLKSKGTTGFGSQDEIVFIPISTAQRFLTGNTHVTTIDLQAQSTKVMADLQSQVTDILLTQHKISDPTLADFTVMNQNDIISAASSIAGTFTILLGSVAAISLVVGGIGIMNMMLTTVTERTREIGLRKAIGARARDISRQFLAEAASLTILGGVIGIILGWIAAFLISKIGGISASVSTTSVVLAFGVSAVIGIVFGYYPARRASRLNPIEALRYE
jgi:putative ABC transport system permease protein